MGDRSLLNSVCNHESKAEANDWIATQKDIERFKAIALK